MNDDKVLDLVQGINHCVTTIQTGMDLMGQTGRVGGLMQNVNIQETLATVAATMRHLTVELKAALKEE